jgi:hypothetical protein
MGVNVNRTGRIPARSRIILTLPGKILTGPAKTYAISLKILK